MSCRSDDLPLLATGRLTGLTRWRLERHVQSCPNCQQELHELRALSDSLRTALQAPPSADLDERVLSIRPGTLEKSRASAQNRPIGGSLMRYPLIVGPLLGISCAMMFNLMQAPVYTATGRLLAVSANEYTANVPTLVELMKATDIQKQVSDQLGSPLPTFTIGIIDKTHVIQVTANGETPNSVSKGVNILMETIQDRVEIEKRVATLRSRPTLPSFDGELRIINKATVPTAPSTPNRALILLSGVLAGILFGGLLTAFRRQSS